MAIPYLYIALFLLALIVLGLLIFYIKKSQKEVVAKEIVQETLKEERKVNDAVEESKRNPVVVDDNWLLSDNRKSKDAS